MTTTTKTTTDTTTKGSASTLFAGRDVKGFTLAPPMMDIRGWKVLGPDGSTLGTVDRIMLDSVEKKPRYLSVTPVNGVGHLLLPIGLGTIDRAGKQVKLTRVKIETLKVLPLLNDDAVTSDFERRLFGVITGKTDSTTTAQQWYLDPVFDPTKLFGTKDVHVPTA